MARILGSGLSQPHVEELLMDGHEWIGRFAAALGIDAPDAALVDELLSLAGEAAHASERIAAPITCYLVGLAGVDMETARRAAASVSGT
jgi:hypothetical protein